MSTHCNPPNLEKAVGRTEESITVLLRRASAGEKEAEHKLMERVYPDLHAMAMGRFGLQNVRPILQPTALVNELYLKLMAGCKADWKNRAHFFAVASQAMRQILLDEIKRDSAKKRGGRMPHIPLDENSASNDDRSIDLLILDEALIVLEEIRPRCAQVVVCRYFGGMTDEEVAEVLDVSSRTVKRDWLFARAWLRDWLSR